MLAPWVSYCRIGDMAIFLDVRQDRYRAMSWECARPLVCAANTPIPPRIADRARDLGWIVEGSSGGARQPPDLGPAEEIDPAIVACRSSGLGVAGAWWLLGAIRFRLATQPLERILTTASAANRKVGSATLPCWSTIAPTLAAFRSAERYVLARNTCLLRSLALHEALARRGVAASLIFGVKLQPFEAHCWVQHGRTLLNDTVERTGLFVPIRVVQ